MKELLFVILPYPIAVDKGKWVQGWLGKSSNGRVAVAPDKNWVIKKILEEALKT